MGTTKEWAERMLREDPDYFKKLGSNGNKKRKTTAGFHTNPELAKKAGKLGGTISRRKKKS